MANKIIGTCFLFSALQYIILGSRADETRDFTAEPGHLKPFGSGRPVFAVDEVEGFPSASNFWKNYVQASKPIKMSGAAKLSPAFNLWTDDYFLSLDLPEESMVHLETMKKENRKQDTVEMHFQEFVQKYNNTEHYMVDSVPQYLGQDVLFPCPLHCEKLMEKGIVTVMMWYSSGGTNSVVHADSVDNINCLFRGEKTFFMVDINKHREKVDLDHPEGLYSSMDVDSVDYTKFPGMADVEYYAVNMTAGDCLYIPYRWIHQVRSYHSNLAINVWWDHYLGLDIDLGTCKSLCDRSISLDNINVQGMNSMETNVNTVKDHIFNLVAVKSRDKKGLLQAFPGLEDIQYIDNEEDKQKMASVLQELSDEFFIILDLDGDGLVTMEDLKTLPDEAWWDAHTYVMEAENMFREMEAGQEADVEEELEDAVDEELLEQDVRDEL